MTPSWGVPRLAVRRGSAAIFPLQCWQVAGLTPSSFAATDVLSAAIYQAGVSRPVSTATADWYTADGTQSGCDQGQVVVSIATGQSDLAPTGGPVSYWLVVSRAAAAAPDQTFDIVRLPLRVRAN